ncbi:MAG TPA: hypothetical protein VN841_13790 [Bryobacteraceae bacterium]|nr:hypothetical protein [Bryobacteraceae bacterium]
MLHLAELKNSWAFPVIEAVHLLGVALFVGATVFVDLRKLGWNVTRQSASELERFFKPWSHAGLAILLTTGPLMLIADWDRYRHNPAVGVKLALVALGLISTFTARRSKTTLIASLALWTGVVLAARAIADFDV